MTSCVFFLTLKLLHHAVMFWDDFFSHIAYCEQRVAKRSEYAIELLSTVKWDFQTARYLVTIDFFRYGLGNKKFFFFTI